MRRSQFTQIPNKFLHAQNLTNVEFRVGAQLFSYSKGRCYPPVSRLKTYTGASERAIQYAIQRLEELQFIQVERKRGKSHHFSIRPETDWLFETPATSAGVEPVRGAISAPGGATSAPQPPQPVHPNYIKSQTNLTREEVSSVSSSDTPLDPDTRILSAPLAELDAALTAAMPRRQYFKDIPELVKRSVEEYGRDEIPLEEVRTMIREKFTGPKGEEIYAKVIVQVESVYADASEPAREQLDRIAPYIQPISAEARAASEARDLESAKLLYGT